MPISELLFRMGNVDNSTVIVDGVLYESYRDIPQKSLRREIYTWSSSEVNNIVIIKIITIDADNDIEKILSNRHGIFPKFSNEQMVLLVNNGVRLIDVINEMEDY